ncbi:MAG TPA: transcriptional repressor, partial [Hyphomicrobiaceae bacterium]|nr:transcriptional repressor [Hyphomicrobiaceae bacterium]
MVIDALKDAGRPLSAYQILDAEDVRSKGLKAPLTIYRALERLVACGLVHRVESLNAFVACKDEPHAEPAAFMICERCRCTIEFSAGTLKQTVGRYASKHGF